MQRAKWTNKMDERLLELYNQNTNSFGHPFWANIGPIMQNEYGVTQEQCMTRYREALNRGARHRKFTPEEDKHLVELVKNYGKNWAEIAKQMGNRTKKQCKERYINYLDPTIDQSPFTPEEDKFIIEKHKILGSKWEIIAHFLPGRTPNQVKNRWWGCLEARRKRISRQQQIPPNQISSATTFDPTFDPTSVESLLNRPIFLSNSVKNHAIGEPEPPLDLDQFLNFFLNHSK